MDKCIKILRPHQIPSRATFQMRGNTHCIGARLRICQRYWECWLVAHVCEWLDRNQRRKEGENGRY
ncbi:unnamed protein product [Mycena citricolor]|uniref:Uncharacterized protein n=1 Tax=Mycena citricolor TaxID=2018698 RepID=A0AAD2HZN0_9AGAR|nr:unnamed protein product [Mycena citricolor]